MKTQLCIAALVGAFAAVPAYAQDADLVGFRWNTIYYGGSIGYGWANSTTRDVNGYNGPFDYPIHSANFAFNVHTGVMFDAGDNVMVGLEAEVGDLNQRGSIQYPPFVGVRLPTDSRESLRADFYYATTLRLGYVFADDMMIYGKIGPGWINQQDRYIDSDPAGTTLVAGRSAHSQGVGLVLGGGVAYALGDGLSARVEYEWLRPQRDQNTALASSGSIYTFKHDLEAQTVMLGLDLHTD